MSGALSLDEALQAYTEKFSAAEPDLYPVLRSLRYFDDADREPVSPVLFALAPALACACVVAARG